MTYFKFFNSKSQKGFTLIELLVVMMIITVIYGALLRNQDSFYEKFQVDEKVDNLAIAFRKAQVYTLGAREFVCSDDGTKRFTGSYGVNVDMNTADRFNPFVFLDANSDGKYLAVDDACYTADPVILSAPGISRICGAISSGPKRCYPGNSATLRQISVTFQRPNPSPVIKFLNTANNEMSELQDHQNTAAYIYFTYPNQPGEAEVKVEFSGQVSVRYCPTTCN